MASISIGFIGISGSDQAVLISAINTAGAMLSEPLSWATSADADIYIVDLDVQDVPEGCALIRYSGDRRRDGAELSRPIRPAVLMAALGGALDQVRARQAQAASSARPAGWYRGAPLAAAPQGETAPAQKPARVVIYRGQRVER